MEKNMYVEVPIFLIFISFSLSVAVTTNFIIYRTCYIILGHNESQCAQLSEDGTFPGKAALEETVQPVASVILMWGSIIGCIVPILLSLNAGPWSDKYGRKPVLLASLTGHFLCFVYIIVLCLLESASPWWWIVSCVISSSGGGLTALLAGCFCYISDVTSAETRGFRMGIYQFFIMLALLIGTLSCSYTFEAVNYIGIYGICAVLVFLAIIYTHFFIEESVREIQSEGALCSLFQLNTTFAIFKTCFKRRQNYDRIILCIIMVILFTFIFAMLGEGQIFYLFVQHKFGWSLEKYTLYNTATTLHATIGTLFGVYVMNKYLKIPDMVVLGLSAVSMCCTHLILGIAQTNKDLYIAGACRFLASIMGPMGRSEISKIIPAKELGEVFSFTTSLETLSQVIAAPIFTYLYNYTLSTDPNAFNFLSLGLYAWTTLLACIVLVIRWRYPTPELQVDVN